MAELNWDQISTTTRDMIVPVLKDNIFNSNVLMLRMVKNSKPATGKKVLEPLIYAKGTSGFYGPYDTFTTQPKEKLTDAEYLWKQGYASITLSGLETEIQNTGPEAVFKLITVESKIAQMTLRDDFGTTFFKTTSAGSKEFDTLFDLIINTQGEVGGINAADYAWWRSKASDAGTAYGNSGDPSWSDVVTTTNRDYIKTMMADVYGQCTEGKDKPTLIVTTQLIWDTYEHVMGEKKRSSSLAIEKLADYGFDALDFRRTPVVVDSHCPDGHMFFINEDYLHFRHAPLRNFKFEPFQKPVNQDVMIAKILWGGTVTCSNRRFQGVLHGLPTAY